MNDERPQNEPVLDPRQILGTIGDDPEMIREFIGVAMSDLEPAMRALGAAVSRGDPAETARSAHALKGLVGNLGGRRAFDAARRLELRAKGGDPGGCAGLADELRAEVDLLRGALGSQSWGAGSHG